MIKVNIEQFIEQAKKAGKYDPQWTVATIRASRKGKGLHNKNMSLESEEINDVIEEQEKQENDIINPISTTQEYLENEDQSQDTNNDTQNNPIIISLPDSLEKIKLLSHIINSQI